jgi:hypothetical protein
VRTNRLLLSLAVLFTIFAGTVGINAQLITSSTIREDVEFWTPLTDPFIIGYGDDFVGTIPMPFTFVYDGTTISNIYAYSNGYISLNTLRAVSYVPELPQDNMVISWYTADLYTGTSLSYKFEGAAPFRVLTVQQLGARVNNDYSGKTIDVQVKFYETTNEVKVIYNNTSGFGGGGIPGSLFFSGNGRYINIQPLNPLQPSNFFYSNINPNVTTWLNSSIVKYMPRGRSFTLTSVPKLSGIFPDANTVLANGYVYSGDQAPYVRVSRSADQKAITIRYKITGPLGPNQTVIYTAVTDNDINSSEQVLPANQPIGTGIRVFMPHAKNIGGRLSDGALDMSVISNFPSGEYQVDATLEYADGTPYSHSISSKFTVAFPSDIALIDVVEPVYNPGSIYQFSGPGVPIKILVKNQGADAVTKFSAKAQIYYEGNNTPEEINNVYNITNNPLTYNTSREFLMSSFKPSAIGKYSIIVTINFDNVNQDKYLINNVYPRTGDPKKIFQVGYQVEVETLSMITPPPTNGYINKPYRIGLRIRNNGVSDVSNTTAILTITSPSGVITTETIPVDEIPSGFVNLKDVFWPNPFIPTENGTYKFSFNVLADLDEVPGNNTKPFTFTSNLGMSGSYTIKASGGDFKTINDAVTALYQRGVSGPVTFLISDPVYNEGNVNLNAPAVDISSTIVGSGPDNPITFAISPIAANRGSVTINLSSASGVGIFIGQNDIPSNPNAPVLSVNSSQIKNYANSKGYIYFDGGSKKSLRFTLNTTSAFRSVFYLGNGASNIKITNCLIEDGINQLASYNCRIPLTTSNSFLDRFEYENDNNVGGTYSAGVVIRNIPPKDKTLGTNPNNMDTIRNHNIQISNNEITKFGYGIVSLGIGALKDLNAVKYARYYNNNNKFDNNNIFGVSRAGMFLGFEDNSEVIGNRIYDVNGVCGNDAAGLIIGGDARAPLFGYNNMNLDISGNEISNILGANTIYGVKIEQTLIKFIDLTEKFNFPEKAENIKLINNMIWGLQPALASTNVIGLAIMTERNTGNDWKNIAFAPKLVDYFTRNDLISNNTIFLANDNVSNTGALVAVALMNTMGATFINNAIGIDDPDINASNTITSALFYYGLHPKFNTLTSDRNAYWVLPANSALFRFIETDIKGRILEQGSKREFAYLDQWQHWTGLDWYSISGNFVKDYEQIGTSPYKMRIKTNPLPLGSILNNRGSSIAENGFDIDRVMRGEAGENYDIGAVEFKGSIFTKDLEIVAITEPGAYRATSPLPFSDADYIMTTAPIAVKGIIRNNGLLVSSSVSATLKIYRESPAGAFIQEGSTMTAPIDELLFSQDQLIDFNTADGINNPPVNPEFFPKTYGELRGVGYTVPDMFISMQANVTPLYKFVIEVPSDNYNANNKWEKVVRFYLRKSPIQLAVTAPSISPIDITPASDINTIATNLNLDSLMMGFFRLGWYINLDLEDPRTDIDVIDRRAWEPRSINYPMYRSLFWVDGHDSLIIDGVNTQNNLSRYDKDQIEAFLASGNFSVKKNFVVSSQEIVRNEKTLNSDWLTNNLSAKYKSPNSPLGAGVSYDQQYIGGLILGRDRQYQIATTKFTNDFAPVPGTFFIDNRGIGNSRIGFTYKNVLGDNPEDNIYLVDSLRIASIATAYTKYNTVLLGLDWRHFNDITGVLRSILDYLEYNDGMIISVDLLNFDAVNNGKRVDLFWKTASEINTDRFDVEKSIVNESGKSFSTIETIKSIGNSSVSTEYGPFVDNKVEYGNTYSYRLKMYERDGKFEYSQEKLVTLTGNNGTVWMNEIVPNPASNIANIEYNLSQNMNIELGIYDLNGNRVLNLFEGVQNSGTQILSADLSKLSSGSYNVVLKADGILLTTKLNVVK